MAQAYNLLQIDETRVAVAMDTHLKEEGAGEFSTHEKSRFYRMAKRSGTETAAILDVANRLEIIQEDNYQKGRELLIRIIMMLTKLAQKTD